MKKIFVSLFLVVVLIVSISSANADVIFNPGGHNCCISSTRTPISDASISVNSRTNNHIPASIDLSESDAFPCFRVQGNESSCVAWATTYYQFGYQVAKLNNWNAKNDPLKQFSPKWTFNYTTYNGSAITYDEAYELLSTQGAVRFSEFTPLTYNDYSEYKQWYLQTNSIKEALRYRVSEVNYLVYASNGNSTPIRSVDSAALTTMKEYINSGHVLTFVTDCGNWVYKNLTEQYDSSLDNQYVCTMLDDSDGYTSGHALSIVGYDDNIKCDINGDGDIEDCEKGAIKVADTSNVIERNQGFIWIMYDAMNNVSSTDLDSSVNHSSIIKDYAYYAIEVEEYSMDLVTEVEIGCTTKGSIKVDLGSSLVSENEPSLYATTLINQKGGKFTYSGLGGDDRVEETATFVFDFGNLCSYPVEWRNYYIFCKNLSATYPMKIKNIKIVDRTGKIVFEDQEDKVLTNASNLYSYSIAMVGDVNNDGYINATDSVLIRENSSGLVAFTDEQSQVADVSGDSTVNVLDATYIDFYLSGSIEEFPNGIYIWVSN